jgi:hypothetical protein
VGNKGSTSNPVDMGLSGYPKKEQVPGPVKTPKEHRKKYL